MITSDTGIDLIKEFESLRLEGYRPTPNDVPTNGWGHTGDDVWIGQQITEEQAEIWLREDVAWAEGVVNRFVAVELTQGQFDALVSFVFNLGATQFKKSILLKLLNTGDYEGAAAEFPKWRRQGKKVLNGLVRRRAAERALFEGE